MIDIDNLRCNYCNKPFITKKSLIHHCKNTNKHKENVIISGIPELDFKSNKMTRHDKSRMERNEKVVIKDGIATIPLYNNYYTLVDDFI